MEARILEAEHQVEAIRAEMHSPEVVSDGPRLQACYKKLQPAEDSVHALYARWAELEANQQSAQTIALRGLSCLAFSGGSSNNSFPEDLGARGLTSTCRALPAEYF